MRHYSRSILGAAIAAVLASPGIVWAQSADAGLRGKAPANADVTVKNVATGATRRTHSSADGTYVLSGLPPGTYRVDAGPGTETTVTLSVASTATLDLTAGSGAVSPVAVNRMTPEPFTATASLIALPTKSRIGVPPERSLPSTDIGTKAATEPRESYQ